MKQTKRDDQLCFLQRKSDGKLLRGSMFFPWVRSWRRAALLDVGTIHQWLRLGYLSQYGIDSLNEVDILVCRDREILH